MKNDEEKECVRRLKTELSIMMGNNRKMLKVTFSGGLTRLEIFALQQIWEAMNESPVHKGIYVSALAKRMDIVLPSASRTLNTLEERGLVYREIDPQSRRNICVFLTKEGERTREKCIKTVDGMMERVIERMGTENMDRMIELWKQFFGLMEEEMNLIEEKKE